MKCPASILAFVTVVAAAPVLAGSVTVPGGSFPMGCSAGDPDCADDEGQPGGVAVPVPAFEIDSHEVTVARYRACVEAGRCAAPKTHQINRYCNYGAPGRDAHPVNCIDWADAAAYCQAQGRRLPREAEWEKAARAGSVGRHPWGQEASCAHAILDDGRTRGSAGDELDGCGEDRSWPVGSRPANGLGLHDMHGNAGEWTANWYAPDALAQYAAGRLDYPETGKQRVVRGGSWDEEGENLRSSFRNVKPPVSGPVVYGSIGFRCAR